MNVRLRTAALTGGSPSALSLLIAWRGLLTDYAGTTATIAALALASAATAIAIQRALVPPRRPAHDETRPEELRSARPPGPLERVLRRASALQIVLWLVALVLVFHAPLNHLRDVHLLPHAGAAEQPLRIAVWVCFGYLVLVYAIYALLLVFAAAENTYRRHELRSEDFEALERSRFTIPVSVVVPVYNEEKVIEHVLTALRGLNYPEFEIIVVNDGSTDATLERIRETQELVPQARFVRRLLQTEEVVAVYRSEGAPSVTVVDKRNGGKADALNCGINFSRYRYVCCVDGDTIYNGDALLRGMRLAVRDPVRTVAVTSSVAISSHPERNGGERTRTLRGAGLLSAFQHIEYLRAFLNNRLAWSRLNFMLCVTGAFSLWRRDVLIELGGFAKDFTCEDLEISFRAHEIALRNQHDYRIVSLPDTVGTTETPAALSSLIAQRARWQRVIMETTWHYRGMLLNPRYRAVGMIGVPVYVMSEAVAPVFELLALAVTAAALGFGVFDWSTYVLLLVGMCFGNGVLTSAAVLLQDRTSHSYSFGHLLVLLLLGPLELLLYRPLLMWARLKGTWGFFRRDRTWDKFERNPRLLPAAESAVG